MKGGCALVIAQRQGVASRKSHLQHVTERGVVCTCGCACRIARRKSRLDSDALEGGAECVRCTRHRGGQWTRDLSVQRRRRARRRGRRGRRARPQQRRFADEAKAVAGVHKGERRAGTEQCHAAAKARGAESAGLIAGIEALVLVRARRNGRRRRRGHRILRTGQTSTV
eukprot:359931-Chlamydomonas_euryale.AAC.8